MADFEGVLQGGITDQSGTGGSRYVLAGRSATAYPTRELPPSEVSPGIIGGSVVSGDLDITEDSLIRYTSILDFEGYYEDGPGLFWFEMVHAHPIIMELGFVLTTITTEMEIYNAYRSESRTLTDADIDAGTGVEFSGLPSLPAVITQSSSETFDVVVSTSGPSTIDGTITFTVSGYEIVVIITGTRIVMFSYRPETPIRETLEFSTNILTSSTGLEQRVSIRKHPRQLIELAYKIEEDSDRRKLQALLFNWQARTFGLPIWFEARKPTADITSGDTVVNVSTAYGDFREGSLAIVWQDADTYDSVEIDTVAANSLTFTSALSNSYTAARTLVMPLRTALTTGSLDGSQHPVNLDELKLGFLINDNEADIADDSAFDSYDSKVLLDDGNWMSSNVIPENLTLDLRRDRKSVV